MNDETKAFIQELMDRPLEPIEREKVEWDQLGHRYWSGPIDISMWRHMNTPFPGYEHIKREHPLYMSLPMSFYDGCSYCGHQPKDMYFDAVTNRIKMTVPCSTPQGITTTITLNVPSGKIVIDDDLRDWYDITEEQDRSFASYNTARGQAQVVEAMAELGCAYGPVGNSCPGLYKTGEGTYVIANPGYDENYDEVDPDKLGTHLAGVVTDLWAYSIADYDDWVSKGGGDTSSWTRSWSRCHRACTSSRTTPARPGSTTTALTVSP